MKYLLRFCALIAAVGAFTAVASADSILLSSSNTTVAYVGYNTNNGNSTPAYDYTNYAGLTGTGFTAGASTATVDISDGGVWTLAIPGSSWVSFENSAPNSGNYPANGTYIYTANLGTGVLDADITLMADDTTAVYLNGILIAGTPAGTGTSGKCTTDTPNCTTPSVFDLPMADFNVSGDNTLTFAVEQLYDNATGLDFQVNAAPEPSSLILLGTGLLGAAGALRRRLRS